MEPPPPELSAALDAALKPLRLLEAIRWGPAVEAAFLAGGGRELPAVTRQSYLERPLPIDPAAHRRLFDALERRLERECDASAGVGRLLRDRCRQGRQLAHLLELRGTADFARLSRDLFGSTLPGGRGLSRLRRVLTTFDRYLADAPPDGPADIPAEVAAEALRRNLGDYFGSPVSVEVTDRVTADAVARGDGLALRRGAVFRATDVRMLEVHEGHVHLGTTRNARLRPDLPCLARPTPTATRTQEGLAVFAELATRSAGAGRVRRLRLRLEALALAERGADFRAVFRFLREHGLTAAESYRQAMRLFRGSLPDAEPFTKDLCYGDGLLRLLDAFAARPGPAAEGMAACLFAGKVALEEVPTLLALGAPTPRWLPAIARGAALGAAVARLRAA